jgi:hypothetical protein
LPLPATFKGRKDMNVHWQTKLSRERVSKKDVCVIMLVNLIK